jgi:membrane protease YdiL (CAAX protease family)
VLIALVTTVAVALGIGLASRAFVAGEPLMFLFAGAPYAVLGGVSLTRMLRRGELGERLRPRPGDVSFGGVVALLLYAAALVGRLLVTPHGSAREGWLMRVYLQVGEPELVQAHMATLVPALALVAAFEEITWRGMVFPSLAERFGMRAAFPLTAVLYALAHAPTIWLLRDPFAGPNPVVVLAALGCGLVWGTIVGRTARLPVVIISHALFTTAVLVYFPLWRLG